MNCLWSALALICLCAVGTANADVLVKRVTYQVDGKPYEGILAYESSSTAKRPGVLVVPEWWGVNQYVENRARQLAGLGYTAFVADMYGKGNTTTDPTQAGKWSGALKGDRMEMRKRIDAALVQLKSQPTVDPTKTAAIGYCFGGTAVLELARSNADVLGVVTFHGGLDASPTGPTADNVKPKILVCHGAADPNVPRRTVEAFEDEMTKAHADWYLILYADAVHAFTNPANPPSNASKGVAYNEKADKRSWIAMQDFFHEIFDESAPAKS